MTYDCWPAVTSCYVMSSFLREKIAHWHDVDRFSSASAVVHVRTDNTTNMTT